MAPACWTPLAVRVRWAARHSRGAASVTLLDTYPKAVAVIRKNVAAVEKAMGRNGTGSSGATGSAARVQQSQALTYVKSASGSWDLVFVDPPYAMSNEQVSELLEALTPNSPKVPWLWWSVLRATPNRCGARGLYCFSTRQHGETVLYYVEPDEVEGKRATSPARTLKTAAKIAV